ncbi:arginine--tRNA ligase [Desulfurococcaceae archaeon MEX13E-LK6-19]|nr:arginine--tRNA ligase [Desulfurococcaceae archaeon MEX13E-LK6-19]
MELHVYRDPFGKLVSDIVGIIVDEMKESGVELSEKEVVLQIAEPPSPSLGDLGVMVARFAKKAGVNVRSFAEKIQEQLKNIEGVSDTKIIGGYVNVFYSSEYLAHLVIDSIKEYPDYGSVPVEKPLRYIVEHTSANPIHPLHIGHARNSFLGDTLANLLRNRGHIVQTRFYVDDTGRQVAILAFGYKLLGKPEPPPGVKPDEWLGRIYALTNLLMELKVIRDKLKEIETKYKVEGSLDEKTMDEYRELVRKQDEIAADLGRLWEKDKELFDKLSEAIMKFEGDFDEEIKKIMFAYEKGEEWAKELVRKVVDLALKGIRETLDRVEVRFDKWDYESELVWSGLVDEVIKKAKSSPYFTLHKGAEALDVGKLAADKNVREKLSITIGGEIPPLILRRSDGTTLYTTKDIAYTIYKFEDFNADKVINVIGAEQRLPQAQIKLALYAIGHVKEAENLITYIYEMVILPGMKMSSRRYRIITLDWILDELYHRAKEEVDKRRSDLDEDERRKIAWWVARAAIKFYMAGTDPLKPLTFVFEKALSMKENSAPYLMYTYARANSVLEKAGGVDWDNIDYSKLGNGTRKRLVWLLGKYPWITSKAADDLSPELLASYLLTLADEFNRWYGEERIIDESDKGLMNLKLAITYGVRHVIGHGLRLFGIKPLPHI